MKKIILIALAMLSFTACERRHKEDVMILYPNWAEGIAVTYLAELILEQKGYTTTLKRIEPGPIYASLSRGDADICMDTWLPHTHKDYWDRFGDRVEIAGTVFNGGVTGLVVPSYVEINSIEELNANKEKFEGGKIYGIAAGSGIYGNTEKAIQKYELDYQQIASSETSMIAATKKAISSKQWIVITGWKPHYKWNMFDLKILEDPKEVYPTDEIKIISRLGFADDQPELAKFFRNFNLSDQQLSELIDDVSANKDPKVGVKKFYEKHATSLDSWVVEKPNRDTK